MIRPALTTSLLVACSALGAQPATEPAAAFESRVVVPLASNSGASARANTWHAVQRPDEQIEARLWWRKGAVDLGAGANLDLAAQPMVATTRTLTPVIGLRARLGDRTRLVAEADTNALTRNAGAEDAAVDSARLAIEFKTKSPLRDLRTSLLRVQLSGQSAIHFRPRGGGVQITYRETF